MRREAASASETRRLMRQSLALWVTFKRRLRSFAQKYPDRPIRVIIPLGRGRHRSTSPRGCCSSLLETIALVIAGTPAAAGASRDHRRTFRSSWRPASAVGTQLTAARRTTQRQRHRHQRPAAEACSVTTALLRAAFRAALAILADRGNLVARRSQGRETQACQEFAGISVKANGSTPLNYSTPRRIESGASAVRAWRQQRRHRDAAQSAGGDSRSSTGWRRSRRAGNMPRPAASWPMARRSATTTGRPPITSQKFCAAPIPAELAGRPADRIRLRHQSEDRRRRSASRCRKRCSPAPKRSSRGETILSRGDCAARRSRRRPCESDGRVRWPRPAYRRRS